MIKEISFDEIKKFWELHLWGNRRSTIEPVSAMAYLGGFDNDIFKYTPTFFGYFINDQLVGVNSGFLTSPKTYRSRGIFVLDQYRGHNIAQQLLQVTERQGKKEGATKIWSMPRRHAMRTYEKFGFEQRSPYFDEGVEFGPNCYVVKHFDDYKDIHLDDVGNQNILYGFQNKGEFFPFAKRTSDDDVYIEKSFPVRREIYDLKTEMQIALKIINSKHDDINVLYSGGIDSEVIVRCLHEMGIPFRTTIWKFDEDLNEHDISYAFEVCNELGITPEVKEVNIKGFWSKHIEDYADPVRTISPQIAFHHYMIDHTDGFLIMGDGRISPRGEHGIFMESCGEKWTQCQWFFHREREGAPKFYRYTPELEAAYANEQSIKDFVFNGMSKDFNQPNFKYFKTMVFQKYFDIKYKPTYTGFESINSHDNYYRHMLVDNWPTANSFCSYEWTLFLRMKSGELSLDNVEYVISKEVLGDLDNFFNYTYGYDEGKHYVAKEC